MTRSERSAGDATASRTAARRGQARAAAGVLGLVLLTSGTAAAAALLSGRLVHVLPQLLDAAGTLAVDRWVELGVLAVGAAAAVWVALSCCLALACVGMARLGMSWRTGEAVLRRTAPGAVRRLSRVALGIGVGAGLALVPTAAHAAGHGAPDTGQDSPVVTFDLGWQPTVEGTSGRAPDPTAPDKAPAAATPQTPASEKLRYDRDPAGGAVSGGDRASTDDRVVVHRGDTLWDIAAAGLGARAQDADVMRAVVRWHDTNRDVIGDDPDVILPGQVLRAPA